MNPTEKYSFDPKTQELLESLNIPFAIYQYIDKRVVAIAISKGFCDQFGFKKLEDAYIAMDSDMYRATHPDDKTRAADAAYRFAAFDAPYDIVYRTRTLKDPDYIILHAYGKSIYPAPGVRLCLTWYAFEGHFSPEQGTYESILSQTLSRFLTEESQYRGTYYDSVTGLPGMSYFYELADAGRKRMQEQNIDSAILFLDLTGLKHFNHRYGFAEGDRLIRSVGAVLAKHFSSENCARFAQDHFAVFAPEEGLTERLDAVIADCANINDGKTLPVRIGIYPDRIEAVNIGTACDRARLAADTKKKLEESCYLYFDMEMLEAEKNRQEIIDNLDRALAEKWIQVYYQPIIRAVNEKVCDAEALARWVDPVKGVLPPSAFIPILEDAGLVYKLDLYMVDRVLESIQAQKAEGFFVVPHSINLSRSDFDACDMVEEIRRRVDEAGVGRDKITIEITESVVGSDFDFMKVQVERFRELGFPVWMDDFGSGYSSLDVLQSIKFDLIKFDMSFMLKLDEDNNGKIILTELMKMALSLGVDTACEGVETREQVRFLQEIGCSKLQGYYYNKPVPFEVIRELRKKHVLIEHEDPDESGYYESVGKVNLYDLGMIASDDENAFHNVFSTLPVAILEVAGTKAKYVRCNRSYREFMERFFSIDILEDQIPFRESEIGYGKTFNAVVRQCCISGSRAFFNETMPDGSLVHSFIRRIGHNPLTGSDALAIAILSVSDPDESTTYEDIARSLAGDYYNLFVIDLDTNDYIEYSSKVGAEEMSLERHGEDFFESARRDTLTRIYEEDRAPFLSLFTKENVLREIDQQGVFTTTYRLIDTGEPMYVNMKITRMHSGNRLILGVSIIDAHMKQQAEEKRLRQERVSLSRVAALSPDYIVLYTVDPETGHYTQYDPSREFASFGLATQGEDFFADVRLDAPKAIVPEDIERHLRVLTKENMIREIKENGYFTHTYRMLMDGKVVPARLKAAMVDEGDGEKIILGVTKDEEDYKRQLEVAYKQASSKAVIYNHLAHALARGYTDLFYVNMETDELIEFHTDDKLGVLNEARRGTDFFEGCARDAKLFVHPEDQEAFVKAMNREFLEKALDGSNVFEMTYRRIKDGRSFYVQMKVTRMEDDKRIIVIAVSDIDELMRQRQAEERMQEERIIYKRFHAITGNFICIYIVDPETDRYREFSATDDYEQSFAQAKDGEDFFGTVREVASIFNHPADLGRFLSAFTKENILAEIEHNGIFALSYRLMMNGKPLHVQLNAAMVEEKDGPRLIVGLNDIDVWIRQEKEYGKQIEKAQSQARIDALTGVKNRYAYRDAEERIDSRIEEHQQEPFSVTVLDLNDLKKINDSAGHQAGDQSLREACRTICRIFSHSPVFRVGGDEFVVISQGHDYENIEDLISKVNEHNKEASLTGGVVIACGMARYENDESVAAVFKRADRNMYENKMTLKSAAENK